MDNLEPKELKELKQALTFVLRWEGGEKFTNDPKDPGGKTKWGISQKAYPEEDIENLTKERALELYKKDYWDMCGCKEIPFPKNVAVFDTAVNCGTKRAKDWLRRSETTDEFLRHRTNHYSDIINRNTNLAKYAKGWWARVADLKLFLKVHEVTCE